MCIPKDDAGNAILKGEELFNHMCHFQNRKHAAGKGEELDEDEVPWFKLIKGLMIHLLNDSLKMIQPTAYDLCCCAILKDYIGNNALCKTTKRKLNNFSLVVGNCDVINSEENMRQQREQLIMAESVAEISRLEAEEKLLRNKQRISCTMRKLQQQWQKLKRKVMQ
jgi:hypothetical protein